MQSPQQSKSGKTPSTSSTTASSSTSRTSHSWKHKNPPKFEHDLGVVRAEFMTQLITCRPDSVLDVGCSFGYTLQKLAELLPDARLAGVDMEQDKLDLAHKFSPTAFETYCAQAHDMPFEDDEFEWVYCAHTLEHCHDIPATITELLRVTRAMLFIVVPLEGDRKFKELREHELTTGNPGSHMHQFNTVDPFVWMEFFRRKDVLPIYYNFTGHSDMIFAMLKQTNVKIAYGGFKKDNNEDLPID